MSPYEQMYRIRAVELEISRRYPGPEVTGRDETMLNCPVHLSIGQEAVAVGVCAALSRSDVVFGTYRSHALYLAKGGSLRKLIYELHGRADGCTGGRGGSMCLYDREHGVMPTSGIVGTPLATAIGYGYAAKIQHRGQLTAVFFGDGACDEGVFYESLNFAALYRLPILFVCENNRFAIDQPIERRRPTMPIHAIPEALGIHSVCLDANPHDVEQVGSFARLAVRRLREGGGPEFMQCQCTLYNQHIGPALKGEAPRLPGNMASAQRQAIDAEIQEAFDECEQ